MWADIVREYCAHALVPMEGRRKVFHDIETAIDVYSALEMRGSDEGVRLYRRGVVTNCADRSLTGRSVACRTLTYKASLLHMTQGERLEAIWQRKLPRRSAPV